MHARDDPVDARIAAIAGRQYGIATYAQLAGAGLGRGAIAHRAAQGRLHRLHIGVYAVGHAAPRAEARWLAAVLAFGAGAVLSHRSAAALWAIRAGEGPLPDVTIPTHAGRAHRGVRVHRSMLDRRDRSIHRGIPVTSPSRTLVDLADVLDDDALVRALRELQFLRLFDLEATREALARRPRRTLRRLVEDLVLAESGLEDRLLALCERHGIPRPLTQQRYGARRVDFVWPDQRVAVETDGWEGHGTRSAFQADRVLSNRLQLDGYLILRFTDTDLRRRPDEVARQLGAALERAHAAAPLSPRS